MQIHQLQPKHKNKAKRRVGRGGKKGTYSGHGIKGQRARAGRKLEPIIRSLIKRYPKLKGYRRFALQKRLVIININTLEKTSKDNEIINSENLIKKGLISKINGKLPKVKILGGPKGCPKLTKKLIIENCKTSKTAKQAIEKAGGSVK